MRIYCFILVLGCLIFSSCSIQKRHYRSGFHIEKKPHEVRNDQYASIKKGYKEVTKPEVSFSEEPDCDTLFLHNGDFIVCRIKGIGRTDFIFNGCSHTAAQNFAIEKRKIDGYVYKNRQGVRISTGHGGPRPALFVRHEHPGYKLQPYTSYSLFACIFAAAAPAAIFFGLLAMTQISLHPEKYYGWNLALVTMIVGAIETIVLLTLLIIALSLL